MAGREHEAVAVGPGGIGGVVLHDPRVEQVGGRARARAARPGWPDCAAWTASTASVRIVLMLSWSSRCLRHRRGSRRSARPSPSSESDLVVAGVAGRAEAAISRWATTSFIACARRLEERARVELGGVRVERLAQRGGDREAPVGVDVDLAHAVADPLLDLLDRDAEGRLELAAGGVDPVDELGRDARGAVHDHVRFGQLAVDLLDQVHREHLAVGLLR